MEKGKIIFAGINIIIVIVFSGIAWYSNFKRRDAESTRDTFAKLNLILNKELQKKNETIKQYENGVRLLKNKYNNKGE